MRKSTLESTIEEPAQKLSEVISENRWIEVVVLRQTLGSVAARTGISPLALRRTMAKQSNAKGTPRLYVALHNQAVIDSAIRRAVCAALSD
jgi:hypothetical protein